MGILAGGPGTGKAQPLDAKVLTPRGFKPIGEIQVGDDVIGRDGNPQKVTGVYPQGIKPIFRLKTHDGRTTECCDEHLWLTCTKKQKEPGSVKPLSKIRSNMIINEGPNRNIKKCPKPTRLNHRLPHMLPCQFNNDSVELEQSNQLQLFSCNRKGRPLPVHPYVLGALIGDGTLSIDKILFTNSEPDIVTRLAEFLPPEDIIRKSADEYSYNIRRRRRSHVPSKTLSDLRLLGLTGHGAYEKFIPLAYMYASIEDRIWLLQGLFDTDGSVAKERIDYSTVSEQLANDVLFIARSLGCIVNLRQKPTAYVYKGERHLGSTYRLSIWCPGFIPIASNKNIAKWNPTPRKYHIRIASIEPCGEKPCVCIQVSNPDGLYVTDDFIVTHNTTVSREVVQRWVSTYDEFNVVALSPTGKASRRFSEVTGFPCHTIHMALLRWEKELKGEGQNSLLPSIRTLKAVLVDEASMVDMYLMDRLLRTLPAGVERILLVGDPDQLPSVGPGCVLRDLIDGKKVPMFKLDQIFRQSEHSWISINARKINLGEMPVIDPQALDYFQFTYDDHESMRNKIREIVQREPDTQVLTPSHRLPIGAEALNEMVRNTINPENGRPGWKAGKIVFHRGDRVIHKKNNYRLGVMNGEVGKAVAVEKIDVRGTPQKLLVVDYDGQKISYDQKTAAAELRLAFALTIHSCVHLDTLVEVPAGLMRIRDIPGGGRIATPFGPSQYANLVQNPPATMLRIETSSGYTLDVTPYHGMFSWNGKSFARVTASDLSRGDVLRLRLGHTFDPKHMARLPHRPASNIRASKHQLPSHLTGDVAELLGLIVADGTVAKNGVVRLVKNYKDVVERFAELCLRVFGPNIFHEKAKVWRSPWEEAWVSEVCSKEVRDWLHEIGGMDPHNKFVPSVVLQSPLAIQARFLRGLFEDGTVNVKKGIVDRIEWDNSSDDTARVVQTMLLRFGIITSRSRRLSHGHGLSALYLYGQNALRFRDVIGFVAKSKNDRLANGRFAAETRRWIPFSETEVGEYLGSSERVNLRARGRLSRDLAAMVAQRSDGAKALIGDRLNWHYERIVSIQKIEDAPSMCVTVPEHGRFLQNGFDGSNSQGSEYDSAIVVLSRSHSFLLSRSLAYTGVTRAKKCVYVIGDEKGIHTAVHKNNPKERETRLKERMNETFSQTQST